MFTVDGTIFEILLRGFLPIYSNVLIEAHKMQTI